MIKWKELDEIHATWDNKKALTEYPSLSIGKILTTLGGEESYSRWSHNKCEKWSYMHLNKKVS